MKRIAIYYRPGFEFCSEISENEAPKDCDYILEVVEKSNHNGNGYSELIYKKRDNSFLELEKNGWKTSPKGVLVWDWKGYEVGFQLTDPRGKIEGWRYPVVDLSIFKHPDDFTAEYIELFKSLEKMSDYSCWEHFHLEEKVKELEKEILELKVMLKEN